MIPRVPPPAALRRLRPLLAVGLLLIAAALAAMLANPQVQHRPISPLAPVEPATAMAPSVHVPSQAAPSDPHDVAVPGWLAVAGRALCLAALVVVVALLLWYLLRNGIRMRERRSTLRPAPPAQARDEVIAAVDAGLSDLDDSDTDPRRAVIACWVRLEQAAAAAGTPREPGDTPTELVTRLLAGHDVSAPVLYPLAEVYRLARYATHTVDTTMRDQARAALRQLRAQLAGQPVAG